MASFCRPLFFLHSKSSSALHFERVFNHGLLFCCYRGLDDVMSFIDHSGATPVSEGGNENENDVMHEHFIPTWKPQLYPIMHALS